MATPRGPNPLTLIMALEDGADPDQLREVLARNRPALDAALEAVGTVHYARFLLLDTSQANLQPSGSPSGPLVLAVITTYDGDFALYVQDFVAQLGDVFDALLRFTADGASLVPVRDHVRAFTAWVAANDASQQPPNSELSQYAAYPYTVQAIKAHLGS